MRRQQIRETILSHIDKERRLFKMGIKCLSPSFIDHVDHYRIYNQGGGTDIRHVYFVAETKGYRDDEVPDYRDTERVKIECARRHFETISDSTVTYDVVKNYAALRDVIVE